jgi:hypothetical protein
MWWGRYVGIPFGDGPGQMNCWALVVAVYRDQLGIDLPSYGEIAARDLLRIAKAMEVGKDDGWCAPLHAQPFDVCLMRSGQGGRAVVHVGIVTDVVAHQPRILHVEEASAAVVVPVTHHSVAGRILGYRRRLQ